MQKILFALMLSSLALLCSLTLVSPPTAQAHAFVIGSDPIDGSTISALPATVRIFFNADISSISSAHVYAIQNNQLVDVGIAPASVSRNDPRELQIPLKPSDSLPRGSYEVKWMAVSNDDGHTSYGLIGFNVGFSSTGLPGTPLLGPSTSNQLEGLDGIRSITIIGGLSVAWEWLITLALIGWVGILVVEQFVLTRNERLLSLRERLRPRTLSLQWLCLGVLLIGEFVTLALRVMRMTQASGQSSFAIEMFLNFLTQSNYGILWLIRIASLLISMILLRWSNQPRKFPPALEPVEGRISQTGPLNPRITRDLRTGGSAILIKERNEAKGAVAVAAPPRGYPVLFLFFAGIILFTLALSSETAQLSHVPITAVMVNWLYLVGQGIWFGSLAYLGYQLLPLLPMSEVERHTETLALLLRRLAPFLLASLGITLACTLFLSETAITSLQQFLNDPYGRTLAVQLGLLACLLLCSFYMLFVLHPRLTRQALLLPVVKSDLPARRTRQFALGNTGRGLKKIVIAQTWLAAAILLCSALLSFFAPPIVFPDIDYAKATDQSTSATGSTAIQNKQVGDLAVNLQVTPGRVSAENTIIVTMHTPDGQAISDAQVRLTSNMQLMDMGTESLTINSGNPTYAVQLAKGETFSMAGLWNIEVSIIRPGQETLQTSFQVNITQ